MRELAHPLPTDDVRSYVFNSDSPLGHIRLTALETGITAIEILVQKEEDGAPSTPVLTSARDEILGYLHEGIQEFKTPIHLNGTAFQLLAWEALLDIPYGETRSYKEQAELIGRPTAARAVARANATNKIPIMVPCHRVVSANGGIGGYSTAMNFGKSCNEGIEIKKFLLHLEG